VVASFGTTLNRPVPLVLLLNGMIPIVNEALADVKTALSTLMSGPRIRTGLLSMGIALAAIMGVTVTAPRAKSTTLEAAKLKSSDNCDVPREGTLKDSLGSRVTLS
jgi:hypothetical protein